VLCFSTCTQAVSVREIQTVKANAARDKPGPGKGIIRGRETEQELMIALYHGDPTGQAFTNFSVRIGQEDHGRRIVTTKPGF
jgi:hypothetical protein